MRNSYLRLIITVILSIPLLAYGQSTLLTVDPGSPSTFTNRSNNYIGTTFTRTVRITNPQQQGQNFNGYLRLKETNGAALSVKIKVSGHNPAKVSLVDPASAATDVFGANGYQWPVATEGVLTFKLTNFSPVSDVIVITEEVNVTACLNNGASVYKSNLTCYLVNTTATSIPADNQFAMIQGGELKQDVFQGAVPVHEIFDWQDSYGYDAGGSPMIKESDFYCSGNGNNKHLKFSLRKKTSLVTDEIKYDDATFRNVVLYFTNQEKALFQADRQSILITKYKTDGTLLQTWNVADQLPDPRYVNSYPNAHTSIITGQDATAPSCMTANQKFTSLIYNIGIINKDEYLTIEYDLYNCCKNPDLFDGNYLQSNQIVMMDYEDDCGRDRNNNKYAAYLGPNTGYWNRGIYMEAQINSAPSTLSGPSAHKSYPDVGNFVVDQPLNSNWYGYGSVYGGVPVIYNRLTAELIVRVKTGPSLRYTAYSENGATITPEEGIYDHVLNPGDFSYYPSIKFIDKFDPTKEWHPIDIHGQVISTVNGYEEREFRFRLVDMPSLANTADKDEIFGDFFNNMGNVQLAFSLEALCSAGDDGNWQVSYLFNTDPTCTNQCLQPLGRVQEAVVVECPGCKVPGAAASGTANRTTYGPYDLNNDGLPDAGETVNSTHTLAEVIAQNRSDRNPSNDLQTTFVCANDKVTINGSFYMTVASDCNLLEHGIDKDACRASDLQYKWAYLQVGILKKGYLEGNIDNLVVRYKRGGSSTWTTINASDVEYHFYTDFSGKDIFYLKVGVTDAGLSASDYFIESDQFDFSFESRVIKNVAAREIVALTYMGYFTKAEEEINVLKTIKPDLFNRSYADCNTTETRGMKPTCDTETLQMICESDGSFLIFIPVITNYNNHGYTAYTRSKDCIKYSKVNNTGFYGGEKSNIGNPGGYGGVNIFKNEFRNAPRINTIQIAIPKGYKFKEIYLNTSNSLTATVDYKINESTMTSAQLTVNAQTDQDRLLTFDLTGDYELITNNPGTAQKLYFWDESFQANAFYVELAPDCKYLIQNDIDESYIGRATINNVNVYSTATTDNNYVGVNGVFNISGDGITKTPRLDTNPFRMEKLNAQGNNFKMQKKTDFVNEFKFVQITDPNLNPNDYYSGPVFFGINKTEIAKYFSEYRVYVDDQSTPLINWSSTSVTPVVFGITTRVPVKVRVEGKINLTNLTTNCDDVKQAKYLLLYGVHCNNTEITEQAIIDATLCNTWSEEILLDLDIVDLQLNVDANSGFPQLSNTVISHEAVFTATRSQLTDLTVNISNSPVSTTTVQSVVIFKNTGNPATDQTVVLTAGTDYTVSLANDVTTVFVNHWPGTAIFQSPTDGENYFNEVRILFDVQNTDCANTHISTTVAGIGTPFYSQTLCKQTRQQTVDDELLNDKRATINFTLPGNVCAGDDITITADITGANISYPVQYTWSPATGDVPTGSTSATSLTYTFPKSAGSESVVLTLTDNTGCTSTGTKVIDVTSAPTISVSGSTTVCPGTSVTLNATASAGTITWSNGATGNSIQVSPTTTTTYTATATAGACSASGQATVTTHNGVVVSVNTSDGNASFICPSGEITLVANTFNSGTAPYTYLWSTGETTSSIDVTAAGTYTVTVTDANLCQATNFANAIDHLEALCPQPVCPDSRPLLTLTNTNGVVGSFTAGWYKSNDPQKNVLNAITEEDYYHAVALAPACTLSTENQPNFPCHVEFLDAPEAYHLIPDEPRGICPGQSVTISVTNPTINDLSITDIQWSMGNKTDLTDVTVTGHNTYFITATNTETGCVTKSNSVYIFGPDIDIHRECFEGDKVKLTATANIWAGNYQWYQVDETTNALTYLSTGPDLIVTQPGLYQVTNDVANMCHTYDVYYESMILTAAPNSEMVGDVDGSFEGLDASCGTTRSFTSEYTCNDQMPNNILNDGIIDYNQLPGHYMINNDQNTTAGDWNRGYWFATALDQDNYMIVDGEDGMTQQVIWQGTYTVQHGVRYLLKANVRNIDVFSLNPPREIPEVYMSIQYADAAHNNSRGYRLTKQVLYNSQSTQWIELSALTDANAKSTVDYTRGEATEATITIYMTGGNAIGRDIALDNIQLYPFGICDEVEVPEDRNCAASIVEVSNENLHTCNGVPVTFTTLNGTGSLIYSWKEMNGNIAGAEVSNTSSLTVTPSVTTSYELTVTDPNPTNGCSFRKVVTVHLLTPEIEISADATNICQTTPITFEVEPFVGIGGMSFQWWSNNTAINGETAVTYAAATLPDQAVIKAQLITGCLDDNGDPLIIYSNEITIDGQETAAEAGPDAVIVCLGDAVELGAPTVSGVTYQWSPSASLSDATIANPVTSSPSDIVYTLTVTDQNGCVSTDEVSVTVPGIQPAVDAGQDVAICFGQSVNLSGSSDMQVTYDWTPQTGLSATNIANPAANPTATTTYTLSVTTVEGCENSDEVEVTVNTLPLVDAGADVSICAGQSTQLSATTGFVSYEWTPIAGLSDATVYNPTASPSSTATYTVKVKDQHNCEGQDDVTVNVIANPTVTITFSAGVATAHVTGGTAPYVYKWYKDGILIGSANQNTYAVTVTGLYKVEVYDANSCHGVSGESNIIISSVTNTMHDQGWNVYPVPATDHVYISSGTGEVMTEVVLKDVLGKDVYHRTGLHTSSYEVELSGLSAGTYVIVIKKQSGEPVIGQLVISR